MRRGDVVLVYVPFVGAPGGKTRPAVVVQNDSLNAAEGGQQRLAVQGL